MLTLVQPLTIFRKVVHEDDLREELSRTGVDRGVNRPDEGRPRLVVEDDDHRRSRQPLRVGDAPAPEMQSTLLSLK